MRWLMLFMVASCGSEPAPREEAPRQDPEPPANLVRHLSGSEADADVTPSGPTLFIGGGGTDVDSAMAAWCAAAEGGDIVVLRTSGGDGYGDYLLELCDADSVETMLVTSRALAGAEYVAWRLSTAEAIFMAGGDQADYMQAWLDTPVSAELQAAWERGAAIGGTSAGAAVMGELVFAAYQGTVYSDEALADPFNEFMTLEQALVPLPPLAGALVDTHFGARDRMGRLVGFLARAVSDGLHEAPLGLGVDEETALVIDSDGDALVDGEGSVYVVRLTQAPTQCVPGEPLVVEGVSVQRLEAGDSLTLPAGTSGAATTWLSAAGGVSSPADPY